MQRTNQVRGLKMPPPLSHHHYHTISINISAATSSTTATATPAITARNRICNRNRDYSRLAHFRHGPHRGAFAVNLEPTEEEAPDTSGTLFDQAEKSYFSQTAPQNG